MVDSERALSGGLGVLKALSDQRVPPSLVEIDLPTISLLRGRPTATHLDTDLQLTAVSCPIGTSSFTFVHEVPPLIVRNTNPYEGGFWFSLEWRGVYTPTA
jgi:hypothetical protein